MVSLHAEEKPKLFASLYDLRDGDSQIKHVPTLEATTRSCLDIMPD